jgi:integrase
MSEGVTINACIEKLRMFRTNAKNDEGPVMMKQIRAADIARRLQNITIRDFIEKHYIPHIHGVKADEQCKREIQHCSSWIIPLIGNQPLVALSTNEGVNILLVLKNVMDKAEKADRTIQYVISTLGQVFKYAQKIGIIQVVAKYPGSELKLSIKSRQRFLTRDEAARLLSLIRERDAVVADMAEFSLLTACRQGELFGMRWQNVSLETASVLLLDTKNKSDRNLYLTGRAVEIIRNQQPGAPLDAVFRDKSGKPYNHRPYCFKLALDDSGLNFGITDTRLKICWHSLRHSSASWLAIAGIDLFKISKILGHKSTRMTERYSHLSEQSLRDALEIGMR